MKRPTPTALPPVPVTATILEDCQSLDVTGAQARHLVLLGLIYKCDDPDCGDFYHIDPEAPDFDTDSGWGAIDRAIEAM